MAIDKNKLRGLKNISCNWNTSGFVQEWTSMSTISTHEPLVGYPFVNVFSVSDGPVGNSTGIPYFFLTDMEISMQDLKVIDHQIFYLSYLHVVKYPIKFLLTGRPPCLHNGVSGPNGLLWWEGIRSWKSSVRPHYLHWRNRKSKMNISDSLNHH